jgi:hypothetical protein
MKFQFRKMAVVMALLGIMVPAQSRADEAAEKGRAILEQYRDSVVTVQLVIKQTYSFPGSPTQEQESKVESTGTVISADGLTVVSLSEVDPSSLMEAMMSGNPQMNGFKMDTDVQDVKLLLTDGTEVPAEIILRDRDLDMAFVRPIKKPDSDFAHVNLEDGGTPLQLDQVITLNKLGKVARRAHSISIERIDAIVTKPRTFYVPGKSPTNTGLGSPAFTLEGKFIGVFFIRAIKATGAQDNVTVILLPAVDIQEAADQAPPFD